MSGGYKYALITGGASGLGRAAAERYTKEGYRVAILDIDEELGQEVSRTLKGSIFIKVDVTDENNVKEAIEAVVKEFGAIHVVLNSAGVLTVGKMFTRSGIVQGSDELHRVLNINVVGTFNVCKFAAKQMASQEPVDKYQNRGLIMNIASIAAWEGQTGSTIYSLSKAAIVGMTLPLAREFGRHQIRVVTLAPGVIRTPMAEIMTEEHEKEYSKCLALLRIGQMDEFADACWGITNMSYLTGEVVRIDGCTKTPKL